MHATLQWSGAVRAGAVVALMTAACLLIAGCASSDIDTVPSVPASATSAR